MKLAPAATKRTATSHWKSESSVIANPQRCRKRGRLCSRAVEAVRVASPHSVACVPDRADDPGPSASGQDPAQATAAFLDSILADAVEAIIAAVYLDGGMDQARQLVRRLLGGRLVDPTPETRVKDPKTRLQEYLQSQGKPLPRYQVIETTGDQHAQTFRVSCSSGMGEDTEGEGGSRRKAEQAAARAMLARLEVGAQ